MLNHLYYITVAMTPKSTSVIILIFTYKHTS